MFHCRFTESFSMRRTAIGKIHQGMERPGMNSSYSKHHGTHQEESENSSFSHLHL